jgi:hypothetical protein
MAWGRADGVLFEVVDGRAVLLQTSGRELITLNQVGSMVWSALDGVREIPQLAADLAERFDAVPVDVLEADITAFLDQLVALDLVVTHDGD